MTVSDEQIGKNVARFRGDLSQVDLAKAMRAQGFKWSQATVWAVEKGERPMRLTEAEALSGILDTSPHLLTQSSERVTPYLMEQGLYKVIEELDGIVDDIYHRQWLLVGSLIDVDDPHAYMNYSVDSTVLDFIAEALIKRLREHDATLEIIAVDDDPEGTQYGREMSHRLMRYKKWVEDSVVAWRSARVEFPGAEIFRPIEVQGGADDGEHSEAP